MEALELAAVAIWSFGVALVGGLVGLVLGNLRLPLIVLLAGSPATGAGANVAISGAAAIAGASRHARAGRVSWRLFAWMAPPSVAGALAGGLLAGVVPERPLLVAIGIVVLYGAWEIARQQRRDRDRPPPADDRPPRAGDPPPAAGEAQLGRAAAIGFGVGLCGGFVGLILGSMRLPAIVRYVGVTPHIAIGTNAAVGVMVGIGGLIGHLPSGIDAGLLAAGCAGAVPGAYLGAQLTGRLPERTLLDACAIVLLVSGIGILVQAVV